MLNEYNISSGTLFFIILHSNPTINKMQNQFLLSFCGDCCSACPRYIATKNNDTAKLQQLALLWYRLGLRDKVLPPDELICTGCNAKKPCNYHINTCEQLNGLNNCGECALFPCSTIENVFKKSEATKMRCKSICSPEEYETIKPAFFQKRELLSEIHFKKYGL